MAPPPPLSYWTTTRWWLQEWRYVEASCNQSFSSFCLKSTGHYLQVLGNPVICITLLDTIITSFQAISYYAYLAQTYNSYKG
jgi:hypothetical protein